MPVCATCQQNPCKCPLKLSASLYGLRGYGLGERNPATLPGLYVDSERADVNEARTRYWRSLRRRVERGVRIRDRW